MQLILLKDEGLEDGSGDVYVRRLPTLVRSSSCFLWYRTDMV